MTQTLRSPLDVLQDLLGEDLSPRPRVPSVGLSVAPAESTGYDLGQTAAPALPKRSPLDVLQELLGEESVALAPLESRPYEVSPQPTGGFLAGMAAPRMAPGERQEAPFEPSPLAKGLYTGWYQQNPQMYGGGLEAIGRKIGSDTLVRMGQEAAKGKPLDQAYLTSAVGRGNIADVQNADELLTWLGEQAGQGIASTGPSIAANLIGRVGGAAVGTAVAGPPGAAVGAHIGGISAAAVPAYLMNTGDLYRSLKDAGADDEQAADLAVKYGGIVTFYDVGALEGIISNLSRPVRGRYFATLAKRLLSGAALEAFTEGPVQTNIELDVVEAATGKRIADQDRRNQVLNAMAAGGATGLVMGAGATTAGISRGLSSEEAQAPLAERPVANDDRAALIHDIAATGAKPTQWLRDNVGKTFDKLTYYDLDLARRVLTGPEEDSGRGLERVEVPPEAQPVGEALAEEAPPAVEMPPPAASAPEVAGEREAAEVEAAPAPAAAAPVRPVVTERPSYLELAYPDGSRGPKEDQKRLRAAKARFWKDRGVWRMATQGAGLTEEVVAQRRELVEELVGAEKEAAAPAGAGWKAIPISEQDQKYGIVRHEKLAGRDVDLEGRGRRLALRRVKGGKYAVYEYTPMATEPMDALRQTDLTEQQAVALFERLKAGTVPVAAGQGPAGEAPAEAAPARPETYWRGDRAEYTGNTQDVSGQTFYEIEVMEGAEQGKLRVVAAPPGGESPSVERNWQERLEQQAEFRRLREEAALAREPWEMTREEYINQRRNWSPQDEDPLASGTEEQAINRYAGRIVSEGRNKQSRSFAKPPETIKADLPDDLQLVRDGSGIYVVKPGDFGAYDIYGALIPASGGSIEHLVVSSQYRKQGVGQALLRAGEQAGYKIDQARNRSDAYLRALHRYRTSQAVESGRPVPAAVLADYPDLQAGQGPAGEAAAEAAPGQAPRVAPETEVPVEVVSAESEPAFERTTPRQGTPEREAMVAETDVLNARSERLYNLSQELEVKAKKTKSPKAGAKYREQAYAFDQERYGLEAQAKKEGIRERIKTARLEDVVEDGDEANRLAALIQLNRAPEGAWEQLKAVAEAEVARHEHELGEEATKQVAFDAASAINDSPGRVDLGIDVRQRLKRAQEIAQQEDQAATYRERAKGFDLGSGDQRDLEIALKGGYFYRADEILARAEKEKEKVQVKKATEDKEQALSSSLFGEGTDVAGTAVTPADYIFRPPADELQEKVKALKGTKVKVPSAGVGNASEREATAYGPLGYAPSIRQIVHVQSGMNLNSLISPQSVTEAKRIIVALQDRFDWSGADADAILAANGLTQEEFMEQARKVAEDAAAAAGEQPTGEGPVEMVPSARGDVGYQQLYDLTHELAEADSDFRRNPVLTVTAVGDAYVQLTWTNTAPSEGGERSYSFRMSLKADPMPTVGQKVRLSERLFTRKGGLIPPSQLKDRPVMFANLAPLKGEERSTILASGFNPLDALKSPVRLAQMAAEELTPKPSPHAFDATLGEEFAEIEERMQGARGLGRVPVGERIEEGFRHFAALWTKEWEHLPRGAEFARLRDALNKLKKQKGVASYKTLEAMQDAVEGLDEGQADLFRRKVILDDLAYEVEQEHALPFGFTLEALERARKAVDAAVAQDEQVAKAIERRKQAWDNLKGTYVRAMKDIGFNADFILKNPSYFRHQVLEYARARRGGAPQGVGTLHTPSSRGMLRRREGSELDINSDYLEAEYEAMSQMFYDVEVARTIKVVDEEHNMLPDLKGQAKSHNYSAMLKALAPVAEERTAQLTPRQIESRVDRGLPEYVTSEEVYRQMLNWKQAKGFKELGEMASSGMLPNNGQWDDVIGDLAAQYEYDLAVAEAAAEGDFTTERPPMDTDTGGILAYAGWLLKAHPGEPGSGAAALIFKGMSEKKQTVRKMLSEIGQFRTWEDFVPKGAVIWQPREGQVFFMADTVPARLVEKALEEDLEELGVPLAALRKAMVMGTPRRQYVLDERVALTLENFTQTPGPWAKGLRIPLNLWKQTVLLGPHKLIRYNIRNLTGDADAAYVGNLSTFQALPRAITNLAGPILKGQKITGEVREWFERGGFGSSLSVQELEEVGDLRIWRDKFPKQDHNAFEALARGVKNKTWRAYWKAARISTDYREALLRYAAYLDYLGQMEKNGGAPNNWGASIREEVMALPDIRDRAFKLSNDLLGAYDEVSVAGQGLRRYAYPFWSWNEVNFRRYKRLMQNAYQDGKLMQAIGRKAMAKYGVAKEAPEGFRGAYIAANVGRFVFRALTVWGVFEAWNRLLFPDDDDRLPEEVKGRPHLTFGEDEDGKIRYFSRIGALGDFLEWFGLDAAPTDVRDFVNGKRTLDEIVKDMALSPVEKVIHGASPYFKTPAELITRKQLFPDPWRPRTIRDRGLYLAQLIGLEKEYAWATDLPSKDASEAVPDLFMYRADPGQAAYSDLYEEKRRYLKTLGLEREGFVWSDRSNALYNARLATRYKDEDGQRKYMLEYFRLGGTMQGMRQSFAMMHPLQGIPKKQQAAFVDGLDNEDRLKLARAIDFYDRVLLGDGGPDRILYGNIGEVRSYLEPDEVRQELARLAADATLAGAGSEPDRRLVKLSRAEGGWKSYKARLDKKDRAHLETAIHNHLTDRLQEMARLRAKVEVLTGAERRDAMADLNRLAKPYGGWPEVYRRFGLRAYPGSEKGVAHWYKEYAQELRKER